MTAASSRLKAHAAEVLGEPEHGGEGELAQRVGEDAAAIRQWHAAVAQRVEEHRLHAGREHVHPAHALRVGPDLAQELAR